MLNMYDLLPCRRTASEVIEAALRSFGLLAPGRTPAAAEVDALIPYLEEVLKDEKVAGSYALTVATLVAKAAAELAPRYPERQPYSKVTMVSNAQMDTLIGLNGDVEGYPQYLAEDGRTWPKRPPVPDSITADSFEVRWMGDSLTESPGAMAILESVPPGFRLDPGLEAFYAGEQWDLKIRADRDAAGRPTLTLNMLPRLVAMAIEKHLSTPGARQLNSIDREFLRLYITLRNRDAQRAFNYMASAALEASKGKEGEGERRIVSPDELGRAVHTAHKSIYSDEKYWQNLGFAAINYYLKQPKVPV